MGFAVNGMIALLILGVAYALASEGLWGAALMFFNVLFAGLIAFNFYEPLAVWMASLSSSMAGLADSLSMLLLFIVTLVILRLTTETIAPAMVRFPTPIYHLGRILFGLACGCLLIAILLLSFYTAPVHKKVFGVISYDTKPPFHQGLDRFWLAFFQYTTGYVFADYSNPSSDSEFGHARVFDPHGEWLILHQNARPYGEDFVPLPDNLTPTATGEGGAPSAGVFPAPEQGARSDRDPYQKTIGGTAGAAVGIANPN
jgi:hypothetical protein